MARELWESANAARGVTRARGRGALLSGIARCASCRHALSGNGRQYKCTNTRCTARVGIKAEAIEANVRALYAMFIATPAAIEAETADELRRALAEAEHELRAFVGIMRATWSPDSATVMRAALLSSPRRAGSSPRSPRPS